MKSDIEGMAIDANILHLCISIGGLPARAHSDVRTPLDCPRQGQSLP